MRDFIKRKHKPSTSLVAVVQFNLEGDVSWKELEQAILRAVLTPAFGLKGRCTVDVLKPPSELEAKESAPMSDPDEAP